MKDFQDTIIKTAETLAIKIDPCSVQQMENHDLSAEIATIDEPDDPKIDEADIFCKGFTTKAELVCLRHRSNPEISGDYVSEFVLEGPQQAVLQFRDANSGEMLDYAWAFTPEGIRPTGGHAADADLDTFMHRNYSDWCGRWHNGRRRWRVCTGKDCSDGIICIVWERKWL